MYLFLLKRDNGDPGVLSSVERFLEKWTESCPYFMAKITVAQHYEINTHNAQEKSVVGRVRRTRRRTRAAPKRQ